MQEFSYLYWHYYPNTLSKGYMYSWFDLSKELNTVYIYSLPQIDIKEYIPSVLCDYIYDVSSRYETQLLDQMGTNGIKNYKKLLTDFGFDTGYKIYKLYSTGTVLDELQTYLLNN